MMECKFLFSWIKRKSLAELMQNILQCGSETDGFPNHRPRFRSSLRVHVNRKRSWEMLWALSPSQELRVSQAWALSAVHPE